MPITKKTKKPNRSVESIEKMNQKKLEKYQTIQIYKEDYKIISNIKVVSYPNTVSKILKHYTNRPNLTVVVDSWGNLQTVNIYSSDDFWSLYDEIKGVNIWTIYKDSELLITCDQAKSTFPFPKVDSILKKYL